MREAARGAASGLVGVACMVGVITTLRRGLLSTEQLATARTHPEKVVVRATQAFGQELDDRTVRRAADAIHFGYGALWGAALAVATERRGLRPVRHGALLAGGLWTAGFGALMPALRIQPGFWTWKRREFVLTLSAHAAYGAGTAGTLRLLRSARVSR